MFDSENDLVNWVRSQLPGPLFCKGHDTLILDEVDLGYGIADLVVADYYLPKVHFRSKVFSNLHIIIIEMLQRVKTIALDAIKTRTRASTRSINQCLQLLLEESFVSIQSDTITLEKEYYSSLQHTVAIEAKMKNWQRALNQAYRYKLFSNQSYVCMPERHSKAAIANLDRFFQMEVGLLIVNEDGALHMIYSPPTEQPGSQKMSMLLNEKLMTTLHSS